MPSNYISLQSLIDDWARESGELQAVILTNVCDHEAAGRFPPGTFRHPETGEWYEEGSLAKLVMKMRESGYGWIREEAADILQEVVVSRAGLLHSLLKGPFKLAPIADYLVKLVTLRIGCNVSEVI